MVYNYKSYISYYKHSSQLCKVKEPFRPQWFQLLPWNNSSIPGFHQALGFQLATWTRWIKVGSFAENAFRLQPNDPDSNTSDQCVFGTDLTYDNLTNAPGSNLKKCVCCVLLQQLQPRSEPKHYISHDLPRCPFFQSIQSPKKKQREDLHGDHAITGFNIDLPKDFEGPHQPINPHGLSAGSWGKFSGISQRSRPMFRQGNFLELLPKVMEVWFKQIRNKMMIFRLQFFK